MSAPQELGAHQSISKYTLGVGRLVDWPSEGEKFEQEPSAPMVSQDIGYGRPWQPRSLPRLFGKQEPQKANRPERGTLSDTCGPTMEKSLA